MSWLGWRGRVEPVDKNRNGSLYDFYNFHGVFVLSYGVYGVPTWFLRRLIDPKASFVGGARGCKSESDDDIEGEEEGEEG